MARMAHLVTWVTEGQQKCLLKFAHYDRVKEITQEKEENPGVFLDQLSGNTTAKTPISPKAVPYLLYIS